MRKQTQAGIKAVISSVSKTFGANQFEGKEGQQVAFRRYRLCAW